jgi:hypothetical protein
MNIFEKIGKFVETVKRDFERGLAPQIAKLNMQIHRPSSGELDAVPSPSDDELN